MFPPSPESVLDGRFRGVLIFFRFRSKNVIPKNEFYSYKVIRDRRATDTIIPFSRATQKSKDER